MAQASNRDDRWGTVELAGLFPAFFDAAPDAIVVVDQSGTIVLANEQTEDLFGYDRNDLVGEKVEVLVPEGLRERHVGHRDAYLEDPTTRPMGAGLSLQAVQRDGTPFPVEISLSPLQTDTGTLVMAAVRDMTERRGAERKFEQLLEGAPDAMLLVDPAGEIELVNEQAEDLFGYDRSELLGEKIEVLVPEALRADHVVYREQYMEDPSTRPMGAGLDLQGVRKDGSEIPVEISLSPLETEEGPRVMAAVRDMTDRKETQRELRARAKQQATVAAMGQRALEEADVDALLEEVVEQALSTLGMDTCEVLELDDGEDVLHLVAGDGWPPGTIGSAQVAMGPGTQAGYTLAAGGAVIVEDYAEETRFDQARVLAENGLVSGITAVVPGGTEPWGVLGVFARSPRTFQEHDADFVQAMANTLGAAVERAQSKRELESYAHRLERSNQEWERFGHVVSHDLQEPIRMINSYLQMLEDRYGDKLGDDAGECIQYAVDGGHRMRELIRGLLAYSRVDTEATAPEVVDVDDVLEDVLADLTLAIEGRGARIDTGGLPRVLVDRSQLSQVLRNLVSNAIKFTPADRKPKVEIAADRSGGMWTLHVKDNGIGIDPEYQDRVFTIFQRLHTRDTYDGEGIGLALCRKIVERHGGQIWVTGNEDEPGSTFHFTLPAVGAKPPPELEPEPVPEPPDV